MSVAEVEATRNAGWSGDNFGLRLMEKMGWSRGKGLGKEESGRTANVTVVRKAENLGLGASVDNAGQQGWSATTQGFSSLLESLNSKYGAAAAVERKPSKTSKKRRRKAMAEASEDGEAAPGRTGKIVAYKKRLRSKDVKGYSATDLASILGAGATSGPDPFAGPFGGEGNGRRAGRAAAGEAEGAEGAGESRPSAHGSAEEMPSGRDERKKRKRAKAEKKAQREAGRAEKKKGSKAKKRKS